MLLLNDADFLEAEREFCRRRLVNFIKRGWHVVEPGQPYVHGRHMDVLCEHLEAVSRGQIKRLLINIPPGTMKSLSTNVFWPSWEWGPMGMPSIRFIGASHEESLAIRDALKMRRLVSSEWYQTLWPDLALVGDQSEKRNFENSKTGWRQACPVKSMTGKRGDRVCWDDPHSVEDAHSPAKLDVATRIFKETLPTRLNSPKESAIIIVMQRLGTKDVSGEILEGDYGYEHLCLPMEYEGSQKITSIGFKDWRTEEGELLFPERFPREVVERDKKVMGAYAVAGQFQQRPSPKSGGHFEVDQLTIVDAIPGPVVKWARGWDLGATTTGDYTVGAKLGKLADGRFIVAHVEREKLKTHDRNKRMKDTADNDGRGRVKQSIPQDPGQAGKDQVLAFATLLAGHSLHFSLESGDKVVRSEPFASQVNAGNVLLLKGPWNKAFIEELQLFPGGSYDDQVDGASRAFNELMQPAAGIHA